MATDARAAILDRIRGANHGASSLDTATAAWMQVPRGFRSTSTLSEEALLDLFTDRLHDYDAQVLCVSESQAVDAITRMLAARGERRMLVPAGFDAHLLPPGLLHVVDHGDLTIAELDACDGVLTTCTVAIAETGSLVLQNVPGQGRRAASLVPDYHLCVVRTADVVATVPEAIARLEATAALPTTFISGPSATADIEMTRIKGVHGPRFLDVVLLTAE